MKDDYEAYEERLLRRKNRWRELRRNLPLKLYYVFLTLNLLLAACSGLCADWERATFSMTVAIFMAVIKKM